MSFGTGTDAPSMFEGTFVNVSEGRALRNPDKTFAYVRLAEPKDGVTQEMQNEVAPTGLAYYVVKSTRRDYYNKGNSRIKSKNNPNGETSNFWIVLADPTFQSSGQYKSSRQLESDYIKPLWFDQDKPGKISPKAMAADISQSVSERGVGETINLMSAAAKQQAVISAGQPIDKGQYRNAEEDKKSISKVHESLSSGRSSSRTSGSQTQRVAPGVITGQTTASSRPLGIADATSSSRPPTPLTGSTTSSSRAPGTSGLPPRPPQTTRSSAAPTFTAADLFEGPAPRSAQRSSASQTSTSAPGAGNGSGKPPRSPQTTTSSAAPTFTPANLFGSSEPIPQRSSASRTSASRGTPGVINPSNISKSKGGKRMKKQSRKSTRKSLKKRKTRKH